MHALSSTTPLEELTTDRTENHAHGALGQGTAAAGAQELTLALFVDLAEQWKS